MKLHNESRQDYPVAIQANPEIMLILEQHAEDNEMTVSEVVTGLIYGHLEAEGYIEMENRP